MAWLFNGLGGLGLGWPNPMAGGQDPGHRRGVDRIDGRIE
jgi:hypothetical protein